MLISKDKIKQRITLTDPRVRTAQLGSVTIGRIILYRLII